MPLSHLGPHNKMFPSSTAKPTGKLTPAQNQSRQPAGTGKLALALQGLNPQSQAEQNPQFGSGSRSSGQGYSSTPPGKRSPTAGAKSALRSGKAAV